jgi:hypothetical protein
MWSRHPQLLAADPVCHYPPQKRGGDFSFEGTGGKDRHKVASVANASFFIRQFSLEWTQARPCA